MEFSKMNNRLFSSLSGQLKAFNLKKLLLSFKQALSSCELCQQPCQKFSLLCDHCEHDLPYFNSKMTQGNLLNWPAINKALTPFQFDHLICLSSYQWPFSTWISQCKYQGRFELAYLLSELLSQHWQGLAKQKQITKPDLVIAIPMHIGRWQERGFNQAHLLAKHFAKMQQLNYAPKVLTRHKATENQVGKSGVERRKNLKNTLKLIHTTKLPEHILLIDDVVTTGATANEACRLLKNHGVKKVTLMTLSISLINNTNE